ncbi:MAG TPA: sigma-70 family RNA polymerase sigma factor [Bryobacteraceae bacterium]|nr:sigma-70 family RNA polymerase sigma factor [Bryobacteraceae bacterium]
MASDAVETTANWTQLVQKIRAGDPQGAVGLYAELAGPVRARLSRVVSPEEIGDRLHEVMVIVLEAVRRGELQDPDRIPGFVRTVTRRRIVAYIRGQVFRRQWMVDGVEMVASRGESPEEGVVRQERIDRLTKVLRCLKKRDREILERFYFREQNAQEICAEMRLTETQFRLFKSRAIARCVDLAQPPPKSQKG